MSSRRAQSLPPHSAESTKPERGRCVTAICFSWKVITCVVSHVTLVLLVVSYCVGGAYLFQHLEKPHEIEVKRAIHYIRLNLTDKIWSISVNVSVLKEDSWISDVKKDLATFEKDILTAIKSDGWDGDEDITKSQWTFAGSLFYSIIVITTIGYGHISPRTDGGKMTTIGYAIIGIPLMLLCLSNIGDVMATSFRFIYWRVCCYTCTRPSKPIRSRSRQHSLRGQRHNPLRMQPSPYRRSMKLMQPHQVHGSTMMMSSYSDPELLTVEPDRHSHLHRQERLEKQRHHQHHASARTMSMNTSSRNFHPYDKTESIPNDSPLYGQSRSPRFNNRAKKRDRLEYRHTIERERHFNRSRKHIDSIEDLEQLASTAKRTLSVRSVRSTNARREKMAKESREMRELNRLHTQPRGRSLLTQPKPNVKATKARAKSVDPRILHNYFDKEDEVIRKTSIITNRYAVEGMKEEKHQKRSQSMPRPNYYQNESARSSYAQKSCYSDAQPIYCTTPRYGNYLELPEFKIERSLPRDQRASSYYTTEYDDAGRGGSYCPENDYNYIERRDRKMHHHHHHNHGNYLPPTDAAAKSLPTHNRERILKGGKNEPLPPSPRIMSPMGFAVNRQIRPRINYDYEEDSWYSDEWNDFHNGDVTFGKDRPVPIWLCVFLVISYILGGAALFAYWEEWSFLDSAYFCFITLTTIGFGDFVPAKGVKDESEQSIAYCSLYLLFGIALLAMSFNLVQEEVIAKVKKVARRLGILKDGDDEYE